MASRAKNWNRQSFLRHSNPKKNRDQVMQSRLMSTKKKMHSDQSRNRDKMTLLFLREMLASRAKNRNRQSFLKKKRHSNPKKNRDQVIQSL